MVHLQIPAPARLCFKPVSLLLPLGLSTQPRNIGAISSLHPPKFSPSLSLHLPFRPRTQPDEAQVPPSTGSRTPDMSPAMELARKTAASPHPLSTPSRPTPIHRHHPCLPTERPPCPVPGSTRPTRSPRV